MDNLVALSIRQPWVDLILRGIKTIEVREWEVKRRGPFLIHSARAFDWRSMELFGYEELDDLPRGGIVGYAEIVDVVRLWPQEWSKYLTQHSVLHPRRDVFFGVFLKNVRPFHERIACPGKPGFFPLPGKIVEKTVNTMEEVGVRHCGKS